VLRDGPHPALPPYPLRPYGVQAGAFGGAFGGPPSPFSSKMERESLPLAKHPRRGLREAKPLGAHIERQIGRVL